MSQQNSKRETGTVKRFNPSKGFGFITCSDGSGDVFVHFTEIKCNGFKTLNKGQQVQFEVITKDDGRRKAINVTGPNGEYVEGGKYIKQHISLLVIGYIHQCEDMHIPSSIKQIILSFYGKAKDGILIIKPNKTVILHQDTQYEFDSIIIHSNGILTTKSWKPKSKKGGKLDIKVLSNVILHENACINLNGKGYRGGKGDRGHGEGGGHNKKYDEVFPGSASYGSKGHNGPNVYGDKFLNTLYLGSGGAGYELELTPMEGGGYDDYDGGDGGGALKISCNQLILKKKAYISCNGSKGDHGTGLGSGGSIHLIIKNELKMDKKSKITAIGGKCLYFKQCGGNGRIRLEITNRTIEPNLNIKPKPYIG